MSPMRLFLGFLICVASLLNFCEAARILCIFPTASVSHQIVFRAFTLALQARGHELVIVTTDPLNDPSLKNYTEIDLHFLYDEAPDTNFLLWRDSMDWLTVNEQFLPELEGISHTIWSLPELKKLYEPNSKEHFDLVVIEVFFAQVYYPLVKRFDAPWIGITSLGISLSTRYAIGDVIMPSYEANWEMGSRISEEVTFWRRLKDFVDVWRHIKLFRQELYPRYEEMAKMYLGDYGSTISEIEKNVSLIFTYQQAPITFARPTVPTVIPIGGFHVSKQIKPMSKELKEILDTADQGFVYVSFGSNAKSTMLPNATREAFITAFSKLPYKVLWKYEDDTLPGKPDNVHTMKWVPQQAVLAHPNIKVFIYQGGLQSTEEALSHAVPLIGFPIFGDQDGQVLKMASLGVAKKLEIMNVDSDTLFEAISTIASDGRYKQRMLNLRSITNDKSQQPLDHAVWWTEHVIRHRGISYLNCDTADLPWYQRGDMDLIVFVTASCLITSLIFIALLYRSTIYVLKIPFGGRKVKQH